MKKRILALMLGLVLAASVTGCGKKTGEEEPTEATEATEATEIETEEATETESDICQLPTAVDEKQEDEKQEAPKKEEKLEDEKPANEEKAPVEAEATVDLSTVRSSIISKLGISDAMMLETPALLNLYGIESSWVKQSASFVTPSGIFPHEIIMVEAVDSASASSVQTALGNRLSEVLVQSETYDAENYAIAQQCKVVKNGNFVALFLSPDQASMRSVYNNYVKD